MGWTPIKETKLVRGKMINFIELNKSEWIFPATQIVHIGWLDNKDEFYSESQKRFIKMDKIAYVHEIPTVPNINN